MHDRDVERPAARICHAGTPRVLNLDRSRSSTAIPQPTEHGIAHRRWNLPAGRSLTYGLHRDPQQRGEVRHLQVQDQAKVRAAFADVYGETFEALENEFVSELACTFQLDVCGETPGEVVGAGWAVMLGGSCDDPDFYGSASADDVMIATQRTIEITKAGRYRLRGNGAKVELTRCGRCAEQTLYEYAYLGEVEVDLDAGRYAIEMMPREESVVLLEIAPIDPWP